MVNLVRTRDDVMGSRDASGIQAGATIPEPIFLNVQAHIWDAANLSGRQALPDKPGFVDNGSGVCLVNPWLLPESVRSKIVWVPSDICLTSASGHSAQGSGPKLMTILACAFTDQVTEHKFTILQKFYSTSSIPYPFLLGRSLI